MPNSYTLGAATPVGGGIVTPGTPLNSVQFNDASAFTGSANFTYVVGTNTVSFGNLTGSALAMAITPLAPTDVENAGTLSISAQNAVQTNSAGGALTLATGAGTGTGANGAFTLSVGATSRLSIASSGLTTLNFRRMVVGDVANGNLGIGSSALNDTLTGTSNVAIGISAAIALSSGADNVAIGSNTLQNNGTGNNNLAIGSQALRNGSGAGGGCIALGSQSQINGVGNNNFSAGFNSLNKASGSHNIGVGFYAGGGVGSGGGNICIGQATAGGGTLTGSDNIIIGNNAVAGSVQTSAASNVIIGVNAANDITSGSNNVCIGANSGTGGIVATSGNVLIGSGAGGTLSVPGGNALQINNANSVTPLVQATFSNNAAGAVFGVNGNLTLRTLGNGIFIKEGSNATLGLATLVAGTVTVANTAVAANSRIFLTTQSTGGTVGFVYISARTAGTSFTITSSSGTDTSSVAWCIITPAA